MCGGGGRKVPKENGSLSEFCSSFSLVDQMVEVIPVALTMVHRREHRGGPLEKWFWHSSWWSQFVFWLLSFIKEKGGELFSID